MSKEETWNFFMIFLSPIILVAFIFFCTVRLFLKYYCRPVAERNEEEPEDMDFTIMATNHLFVTNTPHTYSRIFVDESANVRSVTITRIAPSIFGYVLDPSLLPIHQHPPTYEDSIKPGSPPKYTISPDPSISTASGSIELPTSNISTARVDGFKTAPSEAPIRRSLSDSWNFEEKIEGRAPKSAR